MENLISGHFLKTSLFFFFLFFFNISSPLSSMMKIHSAMYKPASRQSGKFHRAVEWKQRLIHNSAGIVRETGMCCLLQWICGHSKCTLAAIYSYKLRTKYSVIGWNGTQNGVLQRRWIVKWASAFPFSNENVNYTDWNNKEPDMKKAPLLHLRRRPF